MIKSILHKSYKLNFIVKKKIMLLNSLMLSFSFCKKFLLGLSFERGYKHWDMTINGILHSFVELHMSVCLCVSLFLHKILTNSNPLPEYLAIWNIQDKCKVDNNT